MEVAVALILQTHLLVIVTLVIRSRKVAMYKCVKASWLERMFSEFNSLFTIRGGSRIWFQEGPKISIFINAKIVKLKYSI